MTTYLLSQEGRQCRVHAAWWTPDGEETTGVVLLPDRRIASRLATSLGYSPEAIWGQTAESPGDPLPEFPPAMAALSGRPSRVGHDAVGHGANHGAGHGPERSGRRAGCRSSPGADCR